MEGVLRAWGRILAGYRPNLSIELTRECPLHCPGCYAYGDAHLGGGIRLREVRDLSGQALVDGVIALVDRHKPLHLSIVGGEPLVRCRELDVLLPRLAARGLYTQLVTSAVRADSGGVGGDPDACRSCVSIDGLQPDHDSRRAPATYGRIERTHRRPACHRALHRHRASRPRRDGYLDEFAARLVARTPTSAPSGSASTRRRWGRSRTSV